MDGASWWPPPSQPMDGVALRHLLRPFATQQAAAAALQQPVANPLTAHPCQPSTGGPGLSNGLLAQAPGNYSTFGTAMDLKAMFNKLSSTNAAAMVDLTRASTLGGATPLSMYPRHGLSDSSSNEQSCFGTQFPNKSANGMWGTFTGEGSANEGIACRGMQFQDSSAHNLQMLPLKLTTHHLPAPLGDSIRLSCLNIGGEFFMGGPGLFGAICSCHRLKMSIAKFCEHAGGPAQKAGEIVRVENGMSIAQWFKFWAGVGGSFADTKWDWPEWACVKNSPEGYWSKSLPSRNNSIGQIGPLGGYGNITVPLNKQVYSNDLCTEGRGCTNVENIVRRPDETRYKKDINVHESLTNKSSSLPRSMIVNLGLDKNHKVSELDLSQHVMPSGTLNFKASMGNNYNGNQLAHGYGIFLGKNVDVSLHNHGPSSTRVLNHDSRVCMPDVPNKIFQDNLSNASNTELKLGQASCHQSISTLFPSVQSTEIEFQKPQSHTPLVPKNPCLKQTTKVNRSIAKHGELPFVNGNNEQHKVVNGTKQFEGDATNNSSISLFLSHLERNSAPEPIDDVLNTNEHCTPKALDSACSSDRPRIASGHIETRDSDNHSKLAPSMIHMKGKAEIISLSGASGGCSPQELPHANSQEHLMYGNCQPHLLPSRPVTGICKIREVSCPTNCRSCIHVGDKSYQIAHADTEVPCFYDKMARTDKTIECVICDCFCCCKIQEDVYKLGFKPGHLCRTQFPCDDGAIRASKRTCKGRDGFTCDTFVQGPSLFSGEHILQCSCCACPVDGFHHRSYRGHTVDNLTKNTLFDTLSMKERDHCCHGSCCHSKVPRGLPSCGFAKHSDVRTDHTMPGCKHQLQMLARCSTLGENGNSSSQCLSNKIAGGSISQVSLLKDVSNEPTNQPSVATMERPKNVSEASVAGDSKSKAVTQAVTEKKGAYRDSVISKGQPKFGFSSGPSSAVVTKFPSSPEFKNASSWNGKHNKRKNLCDEVSRIEEGSVSSYVPTSTGCEKALNGRKKITGSHLGPSRVKRKCNQISDRSRLADNDSEEHSFGLPKKTRTLRNSVKHSESDDCTRTSSQSSQNEDSQSQNEGTSISRRVFRTKRKYATMCQNKPVKRFHSLKKISKDYDEQQDDKVNFLGGISTSYRKKHVEDVITQAITEQHEGSRVFARKQPKYVSLNCIINEPKSEDACSGIADMDSTLIATGIVNDNRKSPKIVPLNLILKKAKRCPAVKHIRKEKSMHLSKENSLDCSVDSSDCSVYEPSVGNENCSTQAEDEMQVPKKSKSSFNDLRPHIEGLRSPCGAIAEGELAVLKQLSIRSSRGIKNKRGTISLNRVKRLENFSNRPTFNFGRDEDNAVQPHEVNATRYNGKLSSDGSCCVCGILNLEPCNQLIECSKCYIKVHQGCYGVLKVPRGQWMCRPCRTNTQNTVCVLCGYGGGAMTRALKHKNILKSLLKGLTMSTRAKRYADSFVTASSECMYNGFRRNPTDDAHEDNIISTENIISDSWTSVDRDTCLLGRRKMQWVHMVCGLWTPGTKCPNATTMSAFDVSGASPGKRNTACSICSRTGGSFIKCRDLSCSVLFHPWCGRQKGLLQSEPEGERNENVGFYGTCLDHAIDLSNHVNPKKEHRSSDWTCARTEGFKGQKGEGVNHKISEEYYGEFSVSQEQINAWLHINGSKSCGRGQKEYTHYKQLQGQKHLVVYKSGIHGLGLYTSMFISRGSMVVEYVGEIVGQRVADKREIEYQSGKQQQYKSACYFFKIDREHIIDATRKGGIARFVNHSCQPNCVAKIISVRNEKKVVFFAERHINPGEEITYDYHFNREDEGQRIPCFCRSRYCRRYLN